MKGEPKRLTEPKKKYKSKFLIKLQAYENLGSIRKIEMCMKKENDPVKPRKISENIVFITEEDAKKIMRKRKETGLTRKEFSEKHAIRMKAIRRMEEGNYNAKANEFKRVCNLLGLDVHEE